MRAAHSPYIQAAIDGEVSSLASAQVGERNTTLFKSSASLASLGGAKGKSFGTSNQLLTASVFAEVSSIRPSKVALGLDTSNHGAFLVLSALIAKFQISRLR